jgi:methionyl-tRNA formyltransferase
VHGSLLPKYRGGAPIQRAVMNGEETTGVTIMYMAEGLDTGDMISKVEVRVTDEDTAGTMFDKLSVAGAMLLKETLPALLRGELQAVPQNHEEATYAPNISRDDEKIQWNLTTREIYNQVRGLHPWPGSFTTWNDEVLKIWRCRPGTFMRMPGDEMLAPGTVLQMTEEGIEVATGDGTIWLTEIQPAGKKAMEVAQFARGTKLPERTVFI